MSDEDKKSAEEEAKSTPDPAKTEPAKTEEKPHARPAWVHALVVFDAWWTRQEARLCAAVVLAEILALCVWIALKAMSTEYDGQNLLGVVFRGVITATALGLGVHFATRNRMKSNAVPVTLAVVLGL